MTATAPVSSSTVLDAPSKVIEIQNLSKCYGRTVIHDRLNLDIMRGEIVALVGGSGSGKTTLVRQIIGLERPTSGTIKVFGEDISKVDARTARLMRCRSGMLFQQGALFSAMSVFDNVAQPLRELGRVPESLLRDIVMLKLEMVGLPFKHANKMPAALSGGMVKRVGIARAIALEPELLFLDEPTAGLDPQSSEEFVNLIATLHRMLGLTVVMVTHDLDTTVSLSTRVAVLADQRVLICAPVEQVANVDHPFIHDYFLGARGRRALEALPPERRTTLCAAALAPVGLAHPPVPPGVPSTAQRAGLQPGLQPGVQPGVQPLTQPQAQLSTHPDSGINPETRSMRSGIDDGK